MVSTFHHAHRQTASEISLCLGFFSAIAGCLRWGKLIFHSIAVRPTRSHERAYVQKNSPTKACQAGHFKIRTAPKTGRVSDMKKLDRMVRNFRK